MQHSQTREKKKKEMQAEGKEKGNGKTYAPVLLRSKQNSNTLFNRKQKRAINALFVNNFCNKQLCDYSVHLNGNP
jgi:hypothetical protein